MRQTIKYLINFHLHRDEERERFLPGDPTKFVQHPNFEAFEGDLGVEMMLEGRVSLLIRIVTRPKPMWRMPVTVLVRSRSDVS